MTKQIQLTQGMIALVDDADYDFLSQWKWFAHRDGNKWYAERNERHLFGRKIIKMHRAILGNTSKETDHINGNGLDNRRSNLRACSTSENGMNRSKQKNNTSGYKGVYLEKGKNKFKAQINVNNKKITLGRFDTAEQAAKAYDEAVKKYHGKFSKTNF